MSKQELDHREDDEGREDVHLDVDDGCGCTEVWEHMSEHRED